MVHYQSSILNRISTAIAGCIIVLFLLTTVLKYSREPITYNFVELQMKYKHYVVIDKEEKDEDTFILILKNPETSRVHKVKVHSYLYQNVYYVGDKIR